MISRLRASLHFSGQRCLSSARDAFLLTREYINREEQDALVYEAKKALRKAAWNLEHFDSVIANYREYSVGPSARAELYPAIQKLHERVQGDFFARGGRMLDPHILHLAPDGYILPHLDNVLHGHESVESPHPPLCVHSTAGTRS